MTDESTALISKAVRDESRAVCTKVRDAFRYSDPMSVIELEEVEKEIKETFSKFAKAVVEDRLDAVQAIAKELIELIEERNRKCKSLK